MNITRAIDEVLKIAATTNERCVVVVSNGRHKKMAEDIVDELLEYHNTVGDINMNIKRDIKGNTIRNINFEGASLIVTINTIMPAAYAVLDNELSGLRDKIQHYPKMIIADISADDVEWCRRNYGIKAVGEILRKIY